ncbi:MAG: hypothetical protein ACRCV5_16180 [Afipia sp.]
MLEEVVTVKWSGDVESQASVQSRTRPRWVKQFLSAEQRFAFGEAAQAHFVATWHDVGGYWILKRRAW